MPVKLCKVKMLKLQTRSGVRVVSAGLSVWTRSESCQLGSCERELDRENNMVRYAILDAKLQRSSEMLQVYSN